VAFAAMPSPPLLHLEGFGRILERHRYVQEGFTEAEVAVPRDAFELGGKRAPMSPSDQSQASTQAEEGDAKLVAHSATRVSSAEASSICQNILAELQVERGPSQQEGEGPALARGEASSMLHSILAELSLASPPPLLPLPGGEPQASIERADRQDTGRESSWVDSLSFSSRSSSSSSCAKRQVALRGLFGAPARVDVGSLERFPKAPLSGLFGATGRVDLEASSAPLEASGAGDLAPVGRAVPQRQAHIPRLDFSNVRGRFAGPVHEAAFAGPVCEESYSSYRQRAQVDPCACQVSLSCGHLLNFL